MNTSKAYYVLERHEHGWLLCAAPGEDGVPPGAVNDCLPFLPEGAVANTAIADGLNGQGYHAKVFAALGLPPALAAWVKQVDARTATIDAEESWWCGGDGNESSTAIFYALCSDRWKTASHPEAYRIGSIPRTADDFEQCKRLLDLLPEWRKRLPEVAAAYPETKWPAVVARWHELVVASPARQTEILQTL